MDLQHINVKLFVAEPETVDLEAYAVVFNQWIQAQDFEELLVDVADYRHVHHGPGVLLIGHEADYSLDNTGGRLGLLYNRKAPVEGSPAERLAQALRAALRAARRLEQDQGLQFHTRELLILVNDRLLAPNTEATFAAVTPALTTVLDTLYAGAGYSLSRSLDPRERFNVSVRVEAALGVETLLGNLEVVERI